jgi:hypothetical protein
MSELLLAIYFILTFGGIHWDCQEAGDKPIGEPKHCAFVQGGFCCEWRYVIDRYCTTDSLEPIDDCTPVERADDAMNALRSEESWCYKFACGWMLNGEGYYNNWNSNDPLAVAQRKIRKLVVKKKYKKARKAAKKALNHLIKIGYCDKDEPCDDHLEFVINSSKRELKQASSHWITDLDWDVALPESGDESDSVNRRR